MMAPHYERARMLCTAINHVAAELSDPIDRIEVVFDRVVITAGRRRLTLRYHYQNSHAADGSAMPGSGHWVLEKIPAESAGPLQRLLSRLRK
jgi:hypothetical protein